MAYITLAELKAYGDWPSSDDDALLESCITRAQQAIETYTGRAFESSSDDVAARYYSSADEYIDGYTMYLDDDLLAVESITIGSDTVPSSDYVTVPRNDAPYYALTLRECCPYEWGDYDDDPIDNITITANWAYSLAAPADVKQATLRLCKYFYHSANASQDADRTIVMDGVTISPTSMPKDVISLLARYMRIVI